MTITGRPSRAVAAALHADGLEVFAQVVNALNDLQAANERGRAALARGDLGELVKLGTYISDRGMSLVSLATP